MNLAIPHGDIMQCEVEYSTVQEHMYKYWVLEIHAGSSFPKAFSKFNKGLECIYVYATAFEVSFVLTITVNNLHLLQKFSLKIV